jgi:hypothetical protein
MYHQYMDTFSQVRRPGRPTAPVGSPVESSTTTARLFLKYRVGNILAKAADLRVTLNLDGVPITSKSHTHLTHSQSSRLLTSSLSLGVPVPRVTQCM